MLTHGVDLDMFSTPAEYELPALKDVRKPRVGFFGLIDARMNWTLVVQLAERMPEISFVFAGPVDASAGDLPRMENLHFVGPVRYKELPQLIFGIEALVLPYRTGDLAEALSPLKLKEYMATALPVVASAISQARAVKKYVFIAETLSEWESWLKRILMKSIPKEHMNLHEKLRGESWQRKAEEFLSLCCKGEQQCLDIAASSEPIGSTSYERSGPE